ncbi:MAG: hypothetical protein IJS54_06410 [Desulfovibrio sp.]|nr:hypothetical protein [Desulfovibrio sp.]
MSINSIVVAIEQRAFTDSVEENLSRVCDAITHAANLGAQLVLLPEACMMPFGYPSKNLHTYADAFAQTIIRHAEKHHILALVGMFCQGTAQKNRNTLLIAGRGLHHTYTKIHLFDAYAFRESDHTEAGTHNVLLAIDGWVFGLALCYDIRFPQHFLTAAAHGAHAMLLAADWAEGPQKEEQWRLLTRARALDTTSWLLACGQARNAANPGFGIGHSLLIDPYGTIVEELGTEEGTILANLSQSVVFEARNALPVLAHQSNAPVCTVCAH